MKKTKIIVLTWIMAWNSVLLGGCGATPVVSNSISNTPKETTATNENQESVAGETVLMALEEKEENSLYIIRYDLKKGESIDQFLSTLPEQTSLPEINGQPGQESFPVQFAEKIPETVVMLKKNAGTTFFRYNYQEKNWNELLQTKRDVRNWIFDHSNNRLILLSKKDEKPEGEIFELYTADIATTPVEPQKQTEFATSVFLHSFQPGSNEVILISTAVTEGKNTRTLHRLKLDPGAQPEATLIVSEEKPIVDQPSSQSENLQYFAYWSSGGLNIKNLNTKQNLSVSREPAGSLSLLWSPQSNQLLYQPHEQGIWLINLTNGSNKQLSPLASDTFLLWKNSSFVLHLNQDALHLLNTQTGENTYIKSLSSENRILGIH